MNSTHAALGVCLALVSCAVAPQRAQNGPRVTRVLASQGPETWRGSAVPVRCDRQEDGSYLVSYLTAAHVVGGRMWVQEFDPPDYQAQTNLVPVVLSQTHPDLDVGVLLAVHRAPVPCVPLDWRLPEVGERVSAAGYAYGGALSLSEGLVSSTVWYWDFPDWTGAYLTSAFWAPGCSGGAVMGEDGRLLGIIVGGDRWSEHLNIFLPVVLVRDWLAEVLEI